MTAQEFHALLPYIVNFAITVIAVFVLAKKPMRKHLYQRQERMRDAFESAAIAHSKASERISAAKTAQAQLADEEKALLAREANGALQEKQELLQKANAEAQRVLQEADRLGAVELEEASDRVKGQFLRLVVLEAETSLKQSLKKDDHSAILKRAQNSIEVGV